MQRVENQKQQQHLEQKSNYTLQADIATGWKPRMKIIGPMPLNFDNPLLDQIVKILLHSQSSPYKIIYIGLRPKDTFQMHSNLSKNYRYKFKHLLKSNYQHLKPFFRKFYSQFQPLYKLPFTGMNPLYKNNIIFESRFESGNLDYVIKIKQYEYDLYLRIDSNTNGHIMWYYFKIINYQNKNIIIKINICNLRKKYFFYDHCLKPYVYRDGLGWKQQNNNLSITEQPLRFDSLIQRQQDESPPKYRKMSFDLFLSPNQQVKIAYSIPYTYSQLLQDIRELKIEAQKNKQIILDVNLQNNSLSGLQIPYLKIYKPVVGGNQCQQKIKKKQILIIGRQHPGQSNSSYVIKSFYQQLIKSENKKIQNLLNYFNFHIIPMLNPDGVVMGNFRTSLYGKDLNRLFKKNDLFLIPEIEFCKTTVSEIIKKNKKKPFMFLDFHGHSILRNAFCYAPSYFQTNYLEDIRSFPKLIQQITQIWRFPSCSFRISSQKKSTARAVFCQYFNLCYTIQVSNWYYYSKQAKKNIQFTKQLWQKFGRQLMQSLAIFYDNILDKNIKKKNYSIQKNFIKQSIISKNSKNIHIKTQEIYQHVKNNTILSTSNKKTENNFDRTLHNNRLTLSKLSSTKNKISNFHQSTKKSTVYLEQNINKQEQQTQLQRLILQQQQDTDESQNEDMQRIKFKKYIKIITQLFNQFSNIFKLNPINYKSRYQFPKKMIKKKQISIIKKIYIKNYQNQQLLHQTLDHHHKIKKNYNNSEKYYQIHKIVHNFHHNQHQHQRVNSSKKLLPLNYISHKQQKTHSLPKITISNYTIPFQEFNDQKLDKIPRIQARPIKKFKKTNQ